MSIQPLSTLYPVFCFDLLAPKGESPISITGIGDKRLQFWGEGTNPSNVDQAHIFDDKGISMLIWYSNTYKYKDTAVPAEGNGDLQTLICVLVARPRRCLTLSNPVPWQNWMVAYLGYTLWMRTLFRGWPIMVNDTHTRRRRILINKNDGASPPKILIWNSPQM